MFTNFRFPEGTHAKVRHQALQQLGESFQHWKSELNVKYIQKGLTPFHEYGKITLGMCVDLVAQKTSLEALAPNARNRELVKRNMHHHHLGPGGYYRKEAEFRKGEEEPTESRAYNLNGVSKRTKH